MLRDEISQKHRSHSLLDAIIRRKTTAECNESKLVGLQGQTRRRSEQDTEAELRDWVTAVSHEGHTAHTSCCRSS